MSERRVKNGTPRAKTNVRQQFLVGDETSTPSILSRVLVLFEASCKAGGDAMPTMTLDAVSVTTTDFSRAARFYSLLGFAFPAFEPEANHLEAITAAL